MHLNFTNQVGFLFYPLLFFATLSLSLTIHLSTIFFLIQKHLKNFEIEKSEFLFNLISKKNKFSSNEDYKEKVFLTWNQFERKISWLSRISSLSTMTGLLGTVLGIYQSFVSMKESGVASPEVFAAGISTALLTTIIGLCIAIPTLLLFHLFEDWSDILIEKILSYDESNK